ncbi:MAG TPA: hemerythrin domain-containing protein [Mycobacteriales bacterium]|nr:hemerythrin domain-containing protein [Mycobacteriales bacterium]
MTEQQRDVVEVLTHDHREVEDLFGQIEAAGGDPEKKSDLVEQVTIELVRHSVAEEQWLYPAVREKVSGGDLLADQEISEHAEVEQLLKDLERLQPADSEYAAKLASLMSDVRQHVQEEENELFPKLTAASTPDELRELGAKIERAKKTAPTRPHPSSPSAPPANKILAPGAGMIDRLRDALTGRG